MTEAKSKSFFYSNGVITGVSPFDVTLTFQRRGLAPTKLVEPGSSGEAVGVVHDELDVIMSAQHAKSFAAVLLTAVLQYEAQFGKIGLQPREAELLRTAAAAMNL